MNKHFTKSLYHGGREYKNKSTSLLWQQSLPPLSQEPATTRRKLISLAITTEEGHKGSLARAGVFTENMLATGLLWGRKEQEEGLKNKKKKGAWGGTLIHRSLFLALRV